MTAKHWSFSHSQRIGLLPGELSRLEGSDINWEDGSMRIAGRPMQVAASPGMLPIHREHFGTRRKVRLGIRQIQRIVRAVACKAGLNSLVTPDVLQRTWLELSGPPAGLTGRRRDRVLEAAADAAMDVILIVDDKRCFVDLNHAAADVLGLPREELIGRRIEDFFSEAQGKAVPAAWSTFVVQGDQRGVCELKSVPRKSFEFRAKAHFRRGLHLSILREIPSGSSRKNGEHQEQPTAAPLKSQGVGDEHLPTPLCDLAIWREDRLRVR
jgi:PAS domain S-box-containing protein